MSKVHLEGATLGGAKPDGSGLVRSRPTEHEAGQGAKHCTAGCRVRTSATRTYDTHSWMVPLGMTLMSLARS